ncbi:hypothetical protein [Levilactobacillus cerevisiae]|uniref:hypothetical protein n=1 Tax=Levilactobacillus cerevisiae TaxID=1704076 RepID=UPI000F7987D0|nr:hypothetical protein [Levilactobacillus cerevisiae]
MKKGKLTSFVALSVLGLSLATPLAPTQTAQASTTTMPKSLRGTWYQYAGRGSGYDVTKVKSHTVTLYHLSAKGNAGHKYRFSAKKSGTYKLKVQRLHKGYGGTVYSFNPNQAVMWISHRKINGHKYRVMKSYLRQGYFSVSTKSKVAHVASYQYNGSNYMKQIGK